LSPTSGPAEPPAWSANSSRNSRRIDFGEREYRANSAPFTTSGRLISANTGPSRSVKCGASRARSSSVNSSGTNQMVKAARCYPTAVTILGTCPSSAGAPAAPDPGFSHDYGLGEGDPVGPEGPVGLVGPVG